MSRIGLLYENARKITSQARKSIKKTIVIENSILEIQDIFHPLASEDKDLISIYHTHGVRQGIGTCKWHSNPNCHVLLKWKPGKGLGKVVMHDKVSKFTLSECSGQKCKFCW